MYDLTALNELYGLLYTFGWIGLLTTIVIAFYGAIR